MDIIDNDWNEQSSNTMLDDIKGLKCHLSFVKPIKIEEEAMIKSHLRVK